MVSYFTIDLTSFYWTLEQGKIYFLLLTEIPVSRTSVPHSSSSFNFKCPRMLTSLSFFTQLLHRVLHKGCLPSEQGRKNTPTEPTQFFNLISNVTLHHLFCVLFVRKQVVKTSSYSSGRVYTELLPFCKLSVFKNKTTNL